MPRTLIHYLQPPLLATAKHTTEAFSLCCSAFINTFVKQLLDQQAVCWLQYCQRLQHLAAVSWTQQCIVNGCVLKATTWQLWSAERCKSSSSTTDVLMLQQQQARPQDVTVSQQNVAAITIAYSFICTAYFLEHTLEYVLERQQHAKNKYALQQQQQTHSGVCCFSMQKGQEVGRPARHSTVQHAHVRFTFTIPAGCFWMHRVLS